ncbi:beta-ketoacyl-ACP synthase II [Acidicapsa ligni]|uniref:beta-ketoacyl-ACP synthase II n=1 Tax=Acidicapsa ligni TaxID=542300 RepID=UPI0021E07F9B|nr:beta-ketoacyl-ACP synthase II [Acidicapsa ligni]
MTRRVVITGIGLICGVGNTTPHVWSQLLAGVSGVGPIQAFDATGFPVTFAAEVRNFDPLQFIDKKESRKMGRFTHLAIAATQEALEQSGLKITPEIEERVGVFIGSGIGGFEIIEREHNNLLAGGPRKISPFFIPAAIVNMAAGQVSIRYGAKGPISATATACATSAHSIGDSFRMIQHGEADVMLAGGTEAAVTSLTVGGFAAMRALSTRNDNPQAASRPFDKDRDGFVLGEGAGMLVLEELEFAKARGAKILGEIIGYGMSADAYHMTSLAPDGAGAQRSMRAALRDSGVAIEDVDYLNAHATSTPAGDGNESRAIELVFGEHATSKKLKVSSTKSMTGHLLGAAGGLEAGITAMVLMNQKIPPTTNLDNVAEDCILDYVANKAIDAKVDIALSNSFGFGGINASLVMRRWTE